MKKMIVLLLIVSIPVLLFLVTWQNIRFTELSSRIGSIKKQQEETLEKNKSIIVGLAILRSPKRIENIGIKNLGLHEAEPSEVVIITKKGVK